MTNKTFKNIFLTATTALALLLSGCLSEDINPSYNDGAERGVIIRFNNEATRSSTAQGAEPVNFNNGHLFMTNSWGSIVRHFTIHNDTNVGTDVGANSLYMGDLRTTGVEIESVPGSVRRIAIVGNTTLSPAPTVGSNISTVRQQTINVLQQWDVNNVNLWGKTYYTDDEWVFTGITNPRRHYNVLVELFPTVARIELQRIEACPDSDIVGFNVEAIFIDRHYYNAQIDGYTPGTNVEPTPLTNFVNRGQDSSLFQPGERGYDDHATNGALFDIIGTPSTGAGTDANPFAVALSGNNRWAYNLFAMRPTFNASGEIISEGSQKPRIVIRLSDVTLGCGFVYQNYQYLTVRGFLNTATNTPLTGIHALHVYQMSRIRFTEQNLSPRLNEEIDVNVRITLALWNEVPISGTGFHQPNPLNASIGYFERHTFELGAAVNSRCTGTMGYLWQQSTDNGTWVDAVTDVGNNTSAAFTTERLRQNTYFRRVAICACGERHYTRSALVLVALSQPNPANAWVPDGGRHTFNLGVATGGTGIFTYQWQSSLDGTTGWEDVSGATNVTFQTPVLTVGSHRFFRRVAFSGDVSHETEVAEITVWATRNLYTPGNFVANPWDRGRLYQWGTLDGVTHHWDNVTSGAALGWNNSNNRVAWTSANDPCPAGWRVPTRSELIILNNFFEFGNDVAGSTWVLNFNNTGINGRVYPMNATVEQVTSSTPSAIFLPAAGNRRAVDGFLQVQNVWGFYWSNTPAPLNEWWGRPAYHLYMHSGSSTVSGFRLPGVHPSGVVEMAYSVRCVAE